MLSSINTVNFFKKHSININSLIMKAYFSLLLFVVSIRGDSNPDGDELSEENYNKTWIYLSNGDDLPEVAYLTEPPEGRMFATNDNTPIIFEFYTRDNKTTPTTDSFLNRKKRSSFQSIAEHFDPNLDTKIIVHGWKSSSNSDTVQGIKNEYLKRDAYNIIAVNWEQQASNIYYLEPVRYTRQVGKAIAKLIDTLVEEKKANPKRIHLIGHSLGAHTVGYGGSYTKYRVARITGLDPAAPCFEYGCTSGSEGQLDPTDAEFVDIIHSCAGVLGFQHTVGHVDFYPNNGKPPQPGCGNVKEIMSACSHGRSHRFFAESINSESGFYGYPCTSWNDFIAGKCFNKNPILMGDRVPIDSRGVYFLKTRNDFPFALGLNQKKH